MTDTPTLLPPPETGLGHVFRRLALPLFLFSAVLMALLLLSWFLLIPRYTTFPLAGSLVSAVELRAYEQQLTEEIEMAEAKRDDLVLPLRDAAYDALKDAKRAFPSLSLFTMQLQETAREATGQTDVLRIARLSFDASTSTLEVSGDIRNVGPRSMTILAQLVEELDALPGMTVSEPPAFVREEYAEIGFVSPFTLRLTMDPPADPADSPRAD